MPTRRIDQQNGIFILGDPDRAVTFWPHTRYVAIHSAQPRPDLPPVGGPCEHLAGGYGYCDGSSSFGSKLAETWEQSGRDSQVVWAELAEWFRSRFPATVN